MSDRLNFGLIGCGEIAAQTSRAILESSSARVVHCMDVVADLAADLAGKHGARSTTRLENLLADKDVQAVIVSTPHYLHAPLSVQAARAGKHVLSEKPMACTLTQADEMIAAAAAAGVKLGILFPARLDFPYRKAAELLGGGAIGQVLAVKLHGMSNKPPSYWAGGWTGRVKTDWRPKLATSGGGFLIMNQVHDLDMMVGLLDLRPTRIYAEYGTFRTPVEVEDFLSFVMRTENGTLVSVDGSSAAIGGEAFGTRLYGQKGQLHLADGRVRVFLDAPWGDLEAGKWIELFAPQAVTPPNSRAATVDAFAGWVMGQGQYHAPGAEGRRSLEIIRGAYLSMKRGGPVAFPVRE
jgi:predicted dehydrogenase